MGRIFFIIFLKYNKKYLLPNSLVCGEKKKIIVPR